MVQEHHQTELIEEEDTTPFDFSQLSEQEIPEAILELARYNELEDLKRLFDFIEARKGESKSLVEILMREAIDPYSRNTSLHYAAANGHLEEVKYLESIIARSGESSTPLLVEFINSPNEMKNTPLHYAALNGHVSVVEELLAHGADPYLKNEMGKTAYFEACSREMEDVAIALLKRMEKIEGVEEEEEDNGAMENEEAVLDGEMSDLNLTEEQK